MVTSSSAATIFWDSSPCVGTAASTDCAHDGRIVSVIFVIHRLRMTRIADSCGARKRGASDSRAPPNRTTPRTSSTTAETPTATATRSTSPGTSGARSWRTVGRTSSAIRRPSRSSSSARRLAATLRRPTASRRVSRSSATPSPVRAESIRTSTPTRPSSSSRRDTSATSDARPPGAIVSIWLRTTIIDASEPARLRRYPACSASSAYFWGSTTQMRRSTRGRMRSTISRWAGSIESWSGRSRRMSPSRPVSVSPSSSLPRLMRRSESTSSQSSRAVALWLQAQAVTRAVVGRRTPTSAKFRREIALKVLDFPDPVPPARATIVWSTPRESRSSAPARTERACAATAGSSRSPATSRACRRFATWAA